MNTMPAGSHLFTLRLWLAPRPDGEGTWRGQVTHVLSGETRYFREWSRLIGFLEEMGGVTTGSETGNEKKPNVVGLLPSDIE